MYDRISWHGMHLRRHLDLNLISSLPRAFNEHQFTNWSFRNQSAIARRTEIFLIIKHQLGEGYYVIIVTGMQPRNILWCDGWIASIHGASTDRLSGDLPNHLVRLSWAVRRGLHVTRAHLQKRPGTRVNPTHSVPMPLPRLLSRLCS